MSEEFEDVETLVSLRPAAYKIFDKATRAVTLFAPPRHKSMGALSPEGDRVLAELAQSSRRVPAEMSGSSTDTPDGMVEELRREGWLSIQRLLDGTALHTLRPFGVPPGYPEWTSGEFVLSKFCVIRRHRDEIVLENPRGWCDVVIHDVRVLAVASGYPADIASGVRERLILDLRWAGCLVTPDLEAEAFELRQWSAHEFWFHHRSTISRRGWQWEPMAATNWARGQFDPLPAAHPGYGVAEIDLPTPDLAARKREDPPLAQVIDDRHSCRSFDDENPISLDELSELLFRAARTRGTAFIDGREVCARPYPSGGGAYELELYPVIRNVAGIAAGMYRYDSIKHELDAVVLGRCDTVNRLLHSASYTLDNRQNPQALIVIAARPGRLMWTYEQMAYALMLKHVGALTQTLYLVATAMGLGCVALGTGDSAAFADATGHDPTAECSIGDFAVGRRLGHDRYKGLWDYEQ